MHFLFQNHSTNAFPLAFAFITAFFKSLIDISSISVSVSMHKTQDKWIKYFTIYPTTLNIMEEKVENSLQHIGTGDHPLNITPVAQTLTDTD